MKLKNTLQFKETYEKSDDMDVSVRVEHAMNKVFIVCVSTRGDKIHQCFTSGLTPHQAKQLAHWLNEAAKLMSNNQQEVNANA